MTEWKNPGSCFHTSIPGCAAAETSLQIGFFCSCFSAVWLPSMPCTFLQMWACAVPAWPHQQCVRVSAVLQRSLMAVQRYCLKQECFLSHRIYSDRFSHSSQVEQYNWLVGKVLWPVQMFLNFSSIWRKWTSNAYFTQTWAMMSFVLIMNFIIFYREGGFSTQTAVITPPVRVMYGSHFVPEWKVKASDREKKTVPEFQLQGHICLL